MDYWARAKRWADLVGLIGNRIDVAAEICGARYRNAPDSPIRLVSGRAAYLVEVCGELVGEVPIYDLEAAQAMLGRLDVLVSALWYLRRGGVVKFM